MNAASKPTLAECCGTLGIPLTTSHWDLSRAVKQIAAAGLSCNVDGERWWYDYLHNCTCDQPQYADAHRVCPSCHERTVRYSATAVFERRSL